MRGKKQQRRSGSGSRTRITHGTRDKASASCVDKAHWSLEIDLQIREFKGGPVSSNSSDVRDNFKNNSPFDHAVTGLHKSGDKDFQRLQCRIFQSVEVEFMTTCLRVPLVSCLLMMSYSTIHIR